VALTAGTAAIESPTGAITIYRRPIDKGSPHIAVTRSPASSARRGASVVRGKTIKQLELVAGTALERDGPTAEPIKTSGDD
jgi:hypothetical protein